MYLLYLLYLLYCTKWATKKMGEVLLNFALKSWLKFFFLLKVALSVIMSHSNESENMFSFQ